MEFGLLRSSFSPAPFVDMEIVRVVGVKIRIALGAAYEHLSNLGIGYFLVLCVKKPQVVAVVVYLQFERRQFRLAFLELLLDTTPLLF